MTRIYYEVVAQLAPINTVNGSKTITTLTDHPNATTASYDGINSMGFDLTASPFGSFQTGVLFTDSGASGADFTKITGATAGTVSALSVTGVKGGLTSGYYEGANVQALMYTGTFKLDALATGTGSITAAYNGTGAGFAIDCNPSTGALLPANKLSVGATDTNGYLGFNSLTLGVNSVPEPASLSVLALVAIGFLGRRRRRV